MAGWDQDFTVDSRDVDLFRRCMRIWRRTCARNYVEMTYYQSKVHTSGRITFTIGYNLVSVNMASPVGDFVVEMRALYYFLDYRRGKELVKRLAQEVMFVNAYTAREQLDEVAGSGFPWDELNASLRDRVIKVIDDFESIWWSWQRKQVGDAEFLESQHSLIIEIGSVFGSARSKSRFHLVVDGCEEWSPERRRQLKKLAQARNRVKHKEHRQEAAAVSERYLGDVLAAVSDLTGLDLDPVSGDVARFLNFGEDPFRPPMYSRAGTERVPRR